MKTTATALGVGVATIWRWLKSIDIKPWHKESYKLNDAVLDYLRAFVSTHKTHTQSELAVALETMFGVHFSRQCIGVALRKIGLSRKRVSKRGLLSQRSHDSHVGRYQYFKNHFNDKNVISIDEVGFDFRTTPLYGYSERGKKCVLPCLSTTQRKRMTAIVAINRDGGYFYKCHHEHVNAGHFLDFVRALPWPGRKLLMDNASIHRAGIIKENLLQLGHTTLMTVPYMPEMNPVENVFSAVKSRFRKRLLENPAMSYEHEFANIMASLDTPQLFSACFRNTQTFLDATESI